MASGCSQEAPRRFLTEEHINHAAEEEIPAASGYAADVEEADSGAADEAADGLLDTGNIHNYGSGRAPGSARRSSRSGEAHSKEISVPRIAATQAPPFHLPENTCDPTSGTKTGDGPHGDRGALGALSAAGRRASGDQQSLTDSANGRSQPLNNRRSAKGARRGSLPDIASVNGTDEGQVDSDSLNGSDSNTPRSSRKNFIQLMMNSSPQVRRSLVLKSNSHLSARETVRPDSEHALSSSSADEESASVALDPLEHEWMMCASDGEWGSLHRLLLQEPNLVNKKDFVTGFTCFHWAAKLGRGELLALLVNFAKQNAISININGRSSAGYTPLHLAAMHNHLEVVKLLVGAFDADVEARDYSGRTASQYLPSSVTGDIHYLMGEKPGFGAQGLESGAGRKALSKVLPSNLITFSLFNCPEEVCDGDSLVKPKSANRKPAMNIIKPRLPKIWVKSKIVHSTSFREPEDVKVWTQNTVKSRPKSNLFG